MKPSLQKIRVMQESTRFIVEEVNYQGKRAVLKRAKHPKMYTNLQNEIAAYDYYGRITTEPGCQFHIAELLDSGYDYILLSYIEGRSLESTIDTSGLQNALDKIAGISAFCDNKIGIQYQGHLLTRSENQLTRSHKDLAERLQILKSTPGISRIQASLSHMQ